MGGRAEIYGWYRKVWVVVRKSMGGTEKVWVVTQKFMGGAEKVWVVTKSVGFIKIYGWKRKYMGGIINVRLERHTRARDCPQPRQNTNHVIRAILEEMATDELYDFENNNDADHCQEDFSWTMSRGHPLEVLRLFRAHCSH